MNRKLIIAFSLGVLISGAISLFAFNHKQFIFLETLSNGSFNNGKVYLHQPTGTQYILNIDGGIMPVYNADGTLYTIKANKETNNEN